MRTNVAIRRLRRQMSSRKSQKPARTLTSPKAICASMSFMLQVMEARTCRRFLPLCASRTFQRASRPAARTSARSCRTSEWQWPFSNPDFLCSGSCSVMPRFRKCAGSSNQPNGATKSGRTSCSRTSWPKTTGRDWRKETSMQFSTATCRTSSLRVYDMTRKIVVRAIRDVVGITIGCFVYALSFALFVIPVNLAPGGVSGSEMCIRDSFKVVPIGATIIILNTPLFLLSLKRLGKGFLWRSVYATIVSSLLIDAIVPYTHGFHVDMLLSAVYAGVVMGIGIGIIFRFFGSTGGTDLLAQMLSERIGLSFGTTLLIIDTVIIAFSGIAFRSVTIPLYSIVSLYISAKAIDLVQEGISFSKAAWVVSKQPEAISSKVMVELDLSLIHISEPTRLGMISYAVF